MKEEPGHGRRRLAWLIIDVAFVALLAAALIYGVNVWRKRRSAAAERMRDAATRDLYRRSSNE